MQSFKYEFLKLLVVFKKYVKSQIIIPIMKILFKHYNQNFNFRLAIGIFLKLLSLKKN